MGGILQAAGIDGFGTNESTFRRERNVRGNAWHALVREWWERFQYNLVNSAEVWGLALELGVDGDLGLHDSRIREPRVAFGLTLRAQRGRQFRLDAKTEIRIETPEGAPTRRPYCLRKIGENGEMVGASKDPQPSLPGTEGEPKVEM